MSEAGLELSLEDRTGEEGILSPEWCPKGGCMERAWGSQEHGKQEGGKAPKLRWA